MPVSHGDNDDDEDHDGMQGLTTVQGLAADHGSWLLAWLSSSSFS